MAFRKRELHAFTNIYSTVKKKKNSIEKNKSEEVMKCLKNLSIFVLLILVGSIQLAPVDEGRKVYDLIKSDGRFGHLAIIKECESENKPICSALLDIALRFNESKLEFAKSETTNDPDFCQNQLLKVLPDAPASPSTSPLLESLNIAWFKDTQREDDDMCKRECVIKDFYDYSDKVKPVCFFVYEQYKRLLEVAAAADAKKISTFANNASSGERAQQQKRKFDNTVGN
jgi:hypothetical protein